MFSWANELSLGTGTFVHTLMQSKQHGAPQRRSLTGWFDFRCREEKEFCHAGTADNVKEYTTGKRLRLRGGERE